MKEIELRLRTPEERAEYLSEKLTEEMSKRMILEKENARLRAALEQYANDDNWLVFLGDYELSPSANWTGPSIDNPANIASEALKGGE